VLQVPTSQASFLGLLVRPMYEALSMLQPLPTQLANIDTLIQHWRSEM
jgi:hypothetical protein